MTLQETMAELEAFGNESIKKILLKHGIKEPLFGVKVEHLKTIQKKTKLDYDLAKQLFATGNADAMYLAGLITDDTKMTKADLQDWVHHAVSTNISEYTVPWVAAGSHYGWELAQEWIKAPEAHIAAAGWATLSNLVALKPDGELDMPTLRQLLQWVAQDIHAASNRVVYAMNGFVIALASYVNQLTDEAVAAAQQIGPVTVDMNGTACKVPDAITYINKVKEKGKLGKKKKVVKC